MAEALLITLTDIQDYRQVDSKFNQVRFNSFAQEAQRKNLRGFLGDELYLELVTGDRTQGALMELLNGKTYSFNGRTIQFYGLKPALCYWWLAIAARESDLFQSNIGAIQFANNSQQNFETAREKERIAAGYIETAQGYANDASKFLNANRQTYPLWQGQEELNKTNFISFRV
jgi:hypothetical protein